MSLFYVSTLDISLPGREMVREMIQSWQKRASSWRKQNDTKVIKDFDLIHVPGTQRHTAAGLALLVSEHSHAQKIQATPLVLENTRQRWARTIDVNYGDEGMEEAYEHFLQDYMATIDHDFFSGLITRPVCAGDDPVIATDSIVELNVIHSARPMTLSHVGRLRHPNGAHFDRQTKVLTVWTREYHIPEDEMNKEWTEAEFKAVDFEQYIANRDVDAVIMSLIQEMVHIFLRIGSSYDSRDSEARERELLGPHRHGFGIAHWDVLAFIAGQLHLANALSEAFGEVATTSEQNAASWKQHWERCDELKYLGGDDGVVEAEEDESESWPIKLGKSCLWAATIFSAAFLVYSVFTDTKIILNFQIAWGQLEGGWLNFVRSPIPSVGIFLWLFELVIAICRDKKRSTAFCIFQHVMMAFAVCGMMQNTLLGPVAFHDLELHQLLAFVVFGAGVHVYRFCQ